MIESQQYQHISPALTVEDLKQVTEVSKHDEQGRDIDVKEESKKEIDQSQASVQVSKEGISEFLDFKKHWDSNWRRANLEAAKMVVEMLNNSETGLIVVSNITQYRQDKDANVECSNENPYSLRGLIISGKSKNLQFGTFWTFMIKSKFVILEDVYIDGNVYAIDCELQCKENSAIAVQLIVTKNTVLGPTVNTFIPSPIQWNAKIHCDIPRQLQDLEEKAQQYLQNQQFESTISHLQKMLQISTEIFGLDSVWAIEAYNRLGDAYYNKQQHDQAIKYFEKALNICLKVFDVNHIWAGNLYYCLGTASCCSGQYGQALEYHEKALKIKLNVLGTTHVWVSDSYYNLAAVYYNKKQYDKAIESYESALKIRLDVFGNNHKEVAWAYSTIANTYYYRNQYDKAADYYEKALKIKLDILGIKNTEVAQLYYYLGATHANRDKYDKAIECHKKALMIRKEIFGNAHIEIGYSCINLGLAFAEIDEDAVAYEYYEEAWKIFSALLGEWHEETIEAKEAVQQLSESLRDQK
ncbi:hypothetical protein RFI_15486 [Reticulomyxa filosa]|uniref:Uncharacterized protein n=1 Tax=Reticulomyxa filosa TaxID=46433 RepID=X6N7I7_RETFI|nr:hypothetical protein RFI_15486 [Reticulomyxa filosa]|eukprot:ETO21719.1 hypothetical protein RFI_15486 [Reticulomyxa filosa]